MSLPTGTTRGSGRTRSEAAIEAWKHRQRAAPKPGALDPKIAARVAEILAAKQKGKAKTAHGKGKAKTAKPKDARTSQEKKNQARAAVAKQTGMGDLEGTLVRVAAGMAHGGQDLEPEAHNKLIEKGLAKRHADGSVTLSPAGRKWKSAADKGDADAANAALSDAKAGAGDQAAKEQAKGAAKQEREKTKAAKVAERAAKQKKQQQAQKQKAQARQKIASERAKAKAAAGQKKNAAQQQKSKQSAAAKEEKAKAAAGKQAAAQQHKTRVLSEKIKRGEKLSASDQVDAEDAGLVKRAGTKAMSDTDDLAIKAGARHSKMDASHLDEAARHLHAAGATCPDCAPDEEDDGDEAAGKAIKGIMDNPAWYASHECSDIMQAGSALSTLAMLIQSELSEEDEDDADVSQLCDAARTLIKFIESELDELEGAAGDAAEGRTAGDVPMAKAADDAWLHMDGGEIKAVGDDDAIKGLAVLYATKATHDLEKDYYDRNTDLWLDHWGWPRPITYHHGMDAGTRDDPVVGHWTKATVTDEGVWLEGQLDRAHRYYKAVKELARRGYLKISSDSGPQWVIREPQTNGANYIKRWPLVSASVTVTPMEPRMFPVEVKAFLAELGYEAIDTDSPEAINPASAIEATA
jgi:hypothetical protein